VSSVNRADGNSRIEGKAATNSGERARKRSEFQIRLDSKSLLITFLCYLLKRRSTSENRTCSSMKKQINPNTSLSSFTSVNSGAPQVGARREGAVKKLLRKMA